MKTGNNVPAAHARHGAAHHSATQPGAVQHGTVQHGARVRDDNQRQLRDIEELVAKLRVVTKQLQFPAGTSSSAAPPLGTTTSRDEGRRSEHAEGERN